MTGITLVILMPPGIAMALFMPCMIVTGVEPAKWTRLEAGALETIVSETGSLLKELFQ